jgi:DNA-binding HxlR family transcriptional regulator
MSSQDFKNCPIKTAMKYIGKTWTIELIRDLMFKNRRFNDFLHTNPGLSNKILSQRLKELEIAKIIEKKIVSKTPLKIEYELTERGYKLNKVLYEIALFSYEFFKDEIFEENFMLPNNFIDLSKRMFKLA